MRLLAQVQATGCVFVREQHEFRDADRLHRTGMLTAVVAKWSWAGGKRPFRELALFASEPEARKRYRRILPRKGSQ